MSTDTCSGGVDREAVAKLVDELDIMGHRRMGGENDGRLSECEALLEFAIEAKRCLKEEKLTVHIVWMTSAVRALMEIFGGSASLHKLRANGTDSQAVYELLSASEHHLKIAATLQGLSEDFYIRTTNLKERREYFLDVLILESKKVGIPISDLSAGQIEAALDTIKMKEELGHWTDAPKVEGETGEENSNRQLLAKLPFHRAFHARNRIVSQLVDSSDNRNGAGGTNTSTTQMAIRMIWDEWPEGMRVARGKDWQPKRVAAEIINYCGHSADSRAVGRYASNKQAKEREKDRSIQVPSSS